tara:strand:- start:56 stop:427 length:372 start_codon:yes stop_codon:yes gene_type:complete
MRTAFGGSFYQMLNPSTQQIVDNLGLRGQGIGGLASMVVGPAKLKAPATIVKRVDRLIKKFRRQRANYERELANVPVDGVAAQRAADKYLKSAQKTQAELQMVYDRNRGYGLGDYIRSNISAN